jgi:hypothetical protein
MLFSGGMRQCAVPVPFVENIKNCRAYSTITLFVWKKIDITIFIPTACVPRRERKI